VRDATGHLHLKCLDVLVARFSVSDLAHDEAKARLLAGELEYGPMNPHRSPYNTPQEAMEELLDAFNQCAFAFERRELGLDEPSRIELEAAENVAGTIARAIRHCEDWKAARLARIREERIAKQGGGLA
jgi:hypothetical protein